MKIILQLICCTLLFASCNFLKLVDRKQEKRFSKEQIQLHRFRDENGIHAVHYSNNGQPKLMMLHGYGASGISQYYRTSIELNKSFDLILPDLLYCGKSVGDSLDYSIDAQVMHLKTIVDSLGICDSFAVIGNSYGGIVAAYFAEKFPNLVNKLVIYDSPVNDYTMAYADSLAIAMQVPSVKELLSPTTICENRKSLDLIFHDQPYIPRFLRRQMVKYGSLPSRPAQLQLLDHLMEREAQFNAHDFNWKMPVYICWGEFDVLIPVSTCNAIIERYNLPKERVHFFANAAHAANVEYPNEFVEYVKTIMK